MNARDLVDRLHWLGHDSFRLDGPPVIYFDPWKLKGKPPKADLVLVTHEHHDHCSPDDIRKVSRPDTIVVSNTGSAARLPGGQVMRPRERLSAAGIEIEAVHAYNTNKFRSPGHPFHPREAEHVGYVVTVGGVRLYHAGDTDYIPEMEDLDCDVALLPVSGTYVMTVEEAVTAAQAIGPEIVVPMHYGSGIGTSSDGKRLAEMYEGQVVLLAAE
jgi:L-ascorbate metabolism protein UlaG (beta-lactamase superfamily)